MSLSRPQSHGQALALATIGAVVLSPDALLIKFVDADLWSVVFYRNFFLAIFLLIVMWWHQRDNTLNTIRSLGGMGMLSGMMYCLSNIAFIFSILHTTAANTLVILGAMPMASVLMRRIFQKQGTSLRTTVASVVVVCALAYLGSSGLQGDDMWGVVAALVAMLAISAHITILSSYPEFDRAATLGFGGIVAAIVAALMAPNLLVSLQDLFIMSVLGIVVVGGAFMAFGVATRILPSPEVALIMLLEMVLGPLFVWMVLNEVPAEATVWAGVVIAITVTTHSVLGLKMRRAN